MGREREMKMIDIVQDWEEEFFNFDFLTMKEVFEYSASSQHNANDWIFRFKFSSVMRNYRAEEKLSVCLMRQNGQNNMQ